MRYLTRQRMLLTTIVGCGVALLAAGWGCASAEGVPAGPGQPSKDARKRMANENEKAYYEATRRAAEAAQQNPDDVRLQRKAAHLAARSLKSITSQKEPPIEADKVFEWMDPVLKRMSATGSYVCQTRQEAALVYEAADQPKRAAELYSQSVRSCGSAGAALGAARAFRHAEQCDKAIKIVEAGWPNAKEKQHVPLLDAVNRCSSQVNLQQNLKFVPETVVQEYMTLLEDRKQRAREAREAARRRRAAERRRREREARERRCEADCRRAKSDCYNSCSTSECRSSCRSIEHSCLAQCR